MANHISKKLVAGILALSAGFVLASCDPISATPKSYNDAIVMNGDGSKVTVLDENGKKTDKLLKDNLLGKIYDAVATDRNTTIVSKILEEVATKKFGTFYDIRKAYEGTEEEKAAFIDAHADAFIKDNDGSLKEGVSARQIQFERFEMFFNDIKDRISEAFYNEITSGSYNDAEGRFDEEKLWMAHYYEFYKMGELTTPHKFFVTNKITKETAIENISFDCYNVYNERVAYEAEAEGKDDAWKKENPFTARGYVEEKIFPQILKDKLVEEYMYNNDTTYASLGRAYARKVSYIKVSYEDHVIPWKLLKKYADRNIIGATDGNAELDFDVIAQAIKGFKDVGDFETTCIIPLEDDEGFELLKETLGAKDATNTVEVKAADASHYTLDGAVLIPAGTYYKSTKIGELIDSYNKAIEAEKSGRFATGVAKGELEKFISSGKSKQYGLREKLISLAKEDYTTDGWFLKNGGLSELPSQLRDRLFNINVANHLDDGSYPVENSPETMGAYEQGEYAKRLPYMRNVYGKMLLIPAKSQNYTENPYNYIYQDVEGKAFYIVQVLEAPSTPKLDRTQAKSYADLDKDHPLRTEEIAKQVAKILGTKDSYIKDAYTEYLETYTFEFYETSLYEHFKAEYPDLFDEEE